MSSQVVLHKSLPYDGQNLPHCCRNGIQPGVPYLADEALCDRDIVTVAKVKPER
jgi:hypothetical protein